MLMSHSTEHPPAGAEWQLNYAREITILHGATLISVIRGRTDSQRMHRHFSVCRVVPGNFTLRPDPDVVLSVRRENLRLFRRFDKERSGSSGLEFKRPAAGTASGGLRWLQA